MNHWPFIIAAYFVVMVGSAALIIQSYLQMRRLEEKAKALKARK